MLLLPLLAPAGQSKLILLMAMAPKSKAHLHSFFSITAANILLAKASHMFMPNMTGAVQDLPSSKQVRGKMFLFLNFMPEVTLEVIHKQRLSHFQKRSSVQDDYNEV